MNNWKDCKLGDAPFEIIDGDRGKNYPKKDEFFESGYCLFLNTKNVTTNGFKFTELNFITKEKDERLRKGKLKRYDLVLTTRGTVGNVGFYNKNIPFDNMRINSGMVIIRPNGINEKFNYQLFKYLKRDFKIFTSGSAQPQLPIRDLKEISFLFPPLPEQRAIASVLSSLDDKIDLLHRQNRTLEAMAETLFRQWFVEEAKEDWEEGVLSDEFDFTMGQSPPGDSYNEEGIGIALFQGNADFGFRFPADRVYTTDSKRFAEKYDTLVSVRAPVGAQNMAKKKCCIGRGVAAFRYKYNNSFYTYTYFKLKSLMNEIKQYNETGTVFGSISKSDFQKIEIKIPPKEEVIKFQEIAKPIDNKTIKNSIQILTLEKLRDILLPKLMSGEVRVKEFNN